MVPGDDGREEEVVKGLLGNPNRDVELVGWEQSEHGGDGPLHGVLGGGGDALPDDGRVEGFDAAEHVGQGRELVVAGPPGGDEVVGDATAVKSGEEAADDSGRKGDGGGKEVKFPGPANMGEMA